jgi:beta-glucosidase
MNYKDASLPVEQRVQALLGQMTLEEKAGQLGQNVPGWTAYGQEGGRFGITDSIRAHIRENRIGLIYGLFRADPWSGKMLGNGLFPQDSAAVANALQKCAVEETRLGIPLLFSEETPHGHMAIGSTIFPVPLALASTWNPELVKRVGAACGREIRARGATVAYGPVLDLARDPRWSRCEETFGEDPCLAAVLGEALVQGLQGSSVEELKNSGRVISTLKHFAGYGQTEGGKNSSPLHCGEHELREVHLEPFRRAVAAGAQSVMAAYHEIDGLACHAHRKLLTSILREEWGFEGFVVADWCAIEMLYRGGEGFCHRHASNPLEAACLALAAGVDASLGSAGAGTAEDPEEHAYASLVEAVRQGKLPESLLDQACARVLRAKFLLGLFENPYTNENLASCIGSREHLDLAREAAAQGLILLKNEGGLLPLDRNKLKKIAVIGPNADHAGNQVGDYTAPSLPGAIVTVLQGLRREAGQDVEITYAHGCSIRGDSLLEVEEAVAAAKDAEVAVVVVGGSSCRDISTIINEHGQAVPTPSGEMDCGEGYDRDELDLSGRQLDLLKAVQATGTPVVVVLIQGRAHSMEWIAEHIPAVLCAWYPGQLGGEAVAETLFGKRNPAGRLPVSIPRRAAGLPVYYNRKKLGNRGYLCSDGQARYPFGFGLSYTRFEYGEIQLDRPALRPGERARVSVEVANAGARAGDEVVQLYLRDDCATRTRPDKELKAFRRLTLAPGQKQSVEFEITEELLAYHVSETERRAEPGTFRILVGPDSRNLREVVLELLES